TAAFGYPLFHEARSIGTQAGLSFAWGAVVAGVMYVNLAGYQVKAVTGDLTSSASGMFVTSFYSSAAIAGYSFGWLASHAGWTMAGLIQISLLSILGAILAVFIQTDRIALPHAAAAPTRA